MNALIQRFINDESGATMVEYAVMVALVAIVAIVAVVVLGQKVKGAFTEVYNSI